MGFLLKKDMGYKVNLRSNGLLRVLGEEARDVPKIMGSVQVKGPRCSKDS